MKKFNKAKAMQVFSKYASIFSDYIIVFEEKEIEIFDCANPYEDEFPNSTLGTFTIRNKLGIVRYKPYDSTSGNTFYFDSDNIIDIANLLKELNNCLEDEEQEVVDEKDN